jgi:UTP:GlnB (protein PII) uridylyltransferase
MRVCAVCKHAGTVDVGPAAAALVLAFSSTLLHGKNGILEQIASMSATKHMPMASAYCSVCRTCTWLCRDDADINEACVEFMHIWHSTKQMQASLALMHKEGIPLMQSYSGHTHC